MSRAFIRIKTLPGFSGTVTAAQLRLSVKTVGTRSIDVYRTLNPTWHNRISSLTFVNSSQYFSGGTSSAPRIRNAGIPKTGTWSVDITSAFREWHKNPALNYGVALKQSAESGYSSASIFYSSDCGIGSKIPYIYVTYSVNSGTSGKTLTEGEYFIRNVKYNYFMDVRGGQTSGTANGSVVQQHYSNGTAAQIFRVTYNTSGDYYQIQPMHTTNKYLKVASGAKNAKVTINDNPSTVNFRFRLDGPKNAGQGQYRIKTGASNYTMELNPISNKMDNNVLQYNTGYSDGVWEFIPAKASVTLTPGNYYIRNAASGLYLDVQNQTIASTSNIWQHTFNGTVAQRWRVDRDSDGYYYISNLKDSKWHIMITSDARNTGAQVRLYSYSPVRDTQKFKLEKNSNGSYRIIAKGTNLTKSLSPASTADYAVVKQDSISLAKNNCWYFEQYAYSLSMNNYFDHGYSVYWGESEAQSKAAIDNYSRQIAERFSTLFGVQLNYTTNSFTSLADSCKGTVTPENLNAECNHPTYLHTRKDRFTSNFKSIYQGNNKLVNIVFTGHALTENDGTSGNGNFTQPDNHSIFMLYNPPVAERAENQRNSLFHELCHNVGAPDHYHTGDDEVDCGNKYCWRCGTAEFKRPRECLMSYSTKFESYDILCTGCKADILAHLNNHHRISK